MTKFALIAALTVIVTAAGCSSILGFKDPQLDDGPQDAQIGGPTADGSMTPIDGSMTPIDSSMTPIDAPIDGQPAACVPSACPFGCDPDTSMCKTTGTLYVYASTGSYMGSQFGGADTPPDVRAAADGICFATANTTFSALKCDQTRAHAVLQVSSADSLSLMASKYGIPTTAPVHRADDDVVVVDNWNALLDQNNAPRAPVTTGTDANSTVWTGANTTETCSNWTSTTVTGVVGKTNLMVPNWIVRASLACSSFERLLCICWSGSN